MTETTEQPTTSTRTRRGDGLSGMVLADLKALAGQLGIKGTSGLRKGDLVAAIAAHQGGGGNGAARNSAPKAAPATGRTNGAIEAEPSLPLDLPEPPARRRSTRSGGAPQALVEAPQVRTDPAPAAQPEREPVQSPELARIAQQVQPGGGQQDSGDGQRSERPDGEDGGGRNRRNRRGRRDRDNRGQQESGSESGDSSMRETQQNRDAQQRDAQGRESQQREGQGRDNQGRDSQRDNQGRDNQQRDGQGRDQQGRGRDQDQGRGRDQDEDGPGGRRGRRYRERNRRGTRERFADAPDTEIREDDVLVPVAGIVDVLDSYAFIRTSGYLSGSNDVYVSLSQVRKNGLRRGDAVTGAVRAPRDGEQQRQKFNALVRLDTVNGQDPETARQRPEFTKLTPLYPNERLRLETESHILTTRVIDLVMPVGKGQRALIVSPPKAGKTSILQAIANAIATNNPECHLMVVLVDERPEEVTDMQRSVKGEVIASTFDRPPSDHTMIAELAIERAKRLVEMGKDVVVLLDSITRLGRAYNNSSPASGRILSGGVDSTALYPPKRFLGAARNIENGGSLTIFASALVETGSAGDTVIFEEFKGTGNAELKLDRKLADKRLFPAIDVDQSSTRKEELLMSADEQAIVMKLRRVLAALDNQQALELVLGQLRKTRTNVEFLMQVAKNTPGTSGND